MDLQSELEGECEIGEKMKSASRKKKKKNIIRGACLLI
jgi:hypothetical protein